MKFYFKISVKITQLIIYFNETNFRERSRKNNRYSDILK
jgi:hypothetical protein